MPIGVWSTSSTRPTACHPVTLLQPIVFIDVFDLAPTRRARFACSTSRASVDLPDPDTPVITTSRPSGMRALMRCRLCSCAPRISSAAVLRSTRRAGCSGCWSGWARKRPVTDCGWRCSSAAVPAATTCPPRRPAPGPRSITWSARRMVSSSCSTTIRVLPLVCSLASVSSRMRLSRGCRPMVGSSRM